jgi:glutathione synthase/RimK-type ligase-like ATP-grasp enzyme
MIVRPYKLGSESAIDLATGLGVLCSDRTHFRQTVLNWGSIVPIIAPHIINHHNAVINAKDKFRTMSILDGIVRTVEWTIEKNEALLWLTQGFTIYERHTLTGSSGQGIRIVNNSLDLRQALMYTKGIIKPREYRVHIFNGKVIDITQKKRSNDEDSNDFIRNYSNGWIFCRDGINLGSKTIRQCIKAVKELGLDFGAVDVLIKNNISYLLEINSAPGISGTTLKSYIKAIKEAHGNN